MSRARKRKWTSAEVIHALRLAYGVAGSGLVTDEWSLLTEVPLRAPRTGYSGTVHDNDVWSNVRTIDVLLTRNWASGVGFRRIAVEVKVSKSDYRNENEIKRAPAEAAAHQTYYAAPAGIIDPDTLPDHWGLIEVYADREAYKAGTGWVLGEWQYERPVEEGPRIEREFWTKVRTRPTERTPSCNLDYLVSAGMRRASRAEERIRRGADDAAKVPALQAEVTRLTGQLERRDTALHTARDQNRALRSVVAAVEGGQVCSDCHEPVALDARSRMGAAWKHTDRDQEKVCLDARTERNRLEREAKVGARYFRGWADPVMPLSLVEQAADVEYPEVEDPANFY